MSKKEFINSLCENVISSRENKDWESAIKACVDEPSKLVELTSLPEISDIAASHDLALYPSSLLYHSKKLKDK